MNKNKPGYKHKPGIQIDKYGFNESVSITGKKNIDLQHMLYEVVEPMLLEQEKKDKNLKFRLDGHGNSVLDNLEYPARHLIFDYKHGKRNHIYQLKITDVSVNYDENGNSNFGSRLVDFNKKYPNWVFFKNNVFYFFRTPKFKLGANYRLQSDYDFEYDRCNTQDKFTDWIQHLNGKNWVHKTMLSQFMRLADKAHKEKTGENLIGWGSL